MSRTVLYGTLVNVNDLLKGKKNVAI